VLAVKEICIPYTNNLVERLMGEVAKRVKNKWMHWSTKGLENLLTTTISEKADSAKSRFKKVMVFAPLRR
jgi:hypothetical protein